jgi:hypothetical protein
LSKYKSPFCCCKWPTVFACAIPFVATAVCFFVGCFWRRHSPPSDLTLCVFPSSSMLFVDPPCLSPLLSGRSLSVPSESFYFLALLLLSTQLSKVEELSVPILKISLLPSMGLAAIKRRKRRRITSATTLPPYSSGQIYWLSRLCFTLCYYLLLTANFWLYMGGRVG